MQNSISKSTKNRLQVPGWLSEWGIDHKTSAIRFWATQRNLLAQPFRKIYGRFKVYDGLIQASTDDFSGANINFIIEADSIYTGNKRRDKNLLSAGFLNVDQFPFLRFRGISFEKGRGNNYILEGDLTIRGLSKKVVIDVKYLQGTENEKGNTNIFFQSTFQINRHDFGIQSNLFFEAFIEKEITIQLDLEFSRLPENIY